jgi:hypothetical protein
MNPFRKSGFARLAGVWVLIFLLGACGTPQTNASDAPTPSPIPTCVTSQDKFYTSTNGILGQQSADAARIANDIYNQYISQNNLVLAKSQAINLLAYETMRWSRIEDIPVDKNNMVRGIMTFISPELVRAVMLNHVLFTTPGQDLNYVTNTILTSLDNQNEYFFLLSIQPLTINNNGKTVYFPPDEIVLRNNSTLQQSSENNDKFLDQKFDFSSTTHAGLVFFPIARSNNDSICTPVLDQLRDTTITLIATAEIAGQKQNITWNIPFAPALPIGSVLPTPNPNVVIGDNDSKPIENLSGLDLNTQIDTDYWKKLGRFVWAKLTYDYFSLR